jgi:DNA helicase-2/ATP-dependent DNA helicase PcrA
MQEILSDETIPIEENFKVAAGPGAGKTHWLILHVRNVLQNSEKLAKTARVACVTYTNTGVEIIRTKLGSAIERVEVSTIHSFLYNNIVKPYGFLLRDDEGKYLINLRELDRHDEHIPLPNLVYIWKRETNQIYLKDDKKIADCLIDLDWQFDPQGQLELRPRKSWKSRIGKYPIRRDSFLAYKRLYWNIGHIHHEDVLYFAYRLITANPNLLSFIRAKFPYIFVDEFQDTHPIQTAIIKQIGERETIIGVIGDAAQSIYEFQGAKRQDFINFSLPQIKHYVIKDNRRSTTSIVNFLNRIRKDEIEQICLREVVGNKVKLIVGNRLAAVEFATKENGDVIILARNNTTISELKSQVTEIAADLWHLSRSLDSNGERQDLIYNTLYATELIKAGDFAEARKRVGKLFRKHADGTIVSQANKRRYAIMLLEDLAEKHKTNLSLSITKYNNSLFEFIDEHNFNVKLGTKITSGKYKTEFADKHTCEDLVNSLRIKERSDHIMTIHQAKGAQFSNVLLVLTKPDEIERITKADLEAEDDECRIYYVGLSRAENNLYISAPEMSPENRKLMEALGTQILDL